MGKKNETMEKLCRVVHISYCRFLVCAYRGREIFLKGQNKLHLVNGFLEICSEIRIDYLFYLQDIEKTKLEHFKIRKKVLILVFMMTVTYQTL